MRIKTRWLVSATGAILALSAFAAIWSFTHAKGGVTATVYVDGEAVRTIDVDTKPGVYTIETKYGFNVIDVSDGGVCVSDADCPDRLCVKMGRQYNDLVPIACLPHHLVIQIDDSSEESVDAVAGVAP